MTEKEFMRGNDRIKKMRERPGTAEAVEKILAEGEELDRLHRMNLAMIREAGRQTQTDLAKQLQITQGAVSQLERRDDLLWSTLRTYLTATGAENPRIVVTVHGVDVTVEI